MAKERLFDIEAEVALLLGLLLSPETLIVDMTVDEAAAAAVASAVVVQEEEEATSFQGTR